MSSTPAGSVTQQWTAGDTKYFNLIYKDCDGNPVDEFKFEPSETSALIVSPASRASYFFDVELTAANSDIKTLVNGKIDVDTDITRQIL